MLQIENTNATVTIEGITFSACTPSLSFVNVKTVILQDVLIVDGYGVEVYQSVVDPAYNSSLQVPTLFLLNPFPLPHIHPLPLVQVYNSQFIANQNPTQPGTSCPYSPFFLICNNHN